ncbi:MAG: hypothetical protein BM562_09700 [Alphaproteobacteria bacterium MedPE-SWcel]|nr:MAG: hypothetical protein BM562_09700 [Alphaproteobacteria bacterium MedPE-SWcel]
MERRRWGDLMEKRRWRDLMEKRRWRGAASGGGISEKMKWRGPMRVPPFTCALGGATGWRR